MADTTGQLHPHYRTAAKAAAVAAAGLGAAVFAAADPADAGKAAVVAGCIALYAGLRWGAKKLGLRGSLRLPSLRRSTGAGGSKGRSPSLFKRGSGKAPGGTGRRGAGLLPKLGRGTGKGGGGARRGLLPKLGRGGKGKSGTGTAPGTGRRGSLLRRSGKSAVAGKGSSTGRRGLNPLRRSGRKSAGKTAAGGSTGRRQFLPKMGKRSRPGGTGGRSAGRRLGGMRKGGSSSRRSGRSFSPFKRRSGSGGGPGRSRGPGIFKRRTGNAGKGAGLGILRRGLRRGTGTGPPRKGGGKGSPATGGARPGGLGAGLRRYAKFSPKRKLNRAQRTALGAGKLAAAPFALAWLAGRWAWRKARKTPAPQDPEPVPQAAVRPGKEKPEDSPVPSAAPEEPGHRPVRLHNLTEGPTIMNHIDAATEAAQSHIGGWEPENARDLDMFLAALPGYFDGVATAFRTVAAKLADGYPVHPDVPDRLNEIASTIGGMADFSGEAHAVHRNQHQQELERIENPRQNEAFWDVGKQ